MIRTEEEHALAHYGTKRHSGRYPWGSGDDPESTRNRDFLSSVTRLRKEGMTQKQIAEGLGFESTTQLRARISIASAQQRQEKIGTAIRLQEHGYSNSEIGRRMELNESSVRALLVDGAKDKASALESTANMLQKHVNEKRMIDVGKGNAENIGVSPGRFNNAIAVLKEKGYEVHTIDVQQVGTGKYTKTKVLCAPGISRSEVQRNRGDIKLITDHSIDNGRSFITTKPPISINSRRVRINYAEDGGGKADGVIFLRPGVKVLDMGSDRYAQVRIMVDGTHYLKGMAVYKDDLPQGTDIVFNTKKSNTGRKKDAMKEISKKDPDLPFESIVRQIQDPSGKVTSALNIVGSPTKERSGVEGSWDNWSRNLSAQMLSKQSPDLAKQQLGVTFERRTKELAEINSLTNPVVKKKLLLGFADSTDAAAIHLKAASLPRQATKVILPVSSMKPGEVYARGYDNGERVALVRFPHSGPFEIPQLTVNNRNPEARKLLGKAKDAIGIHHSVAEHLSGADFDGDTVLLIPNNKGLVKSQDPLEGLKDFDPMKFALPKESPIPRMTDQQKGQEMGSISNLITDMTLHKAPSDEMARAVRHSMVVIDAKKHELDWRRSEKENNILQLKQKYQIYEGRKRGGASTLISQKKATNRIDQIIERPASRGGPIDPNTGEKVFERTGRMRPEYRTVVDPVSKKKVKVQTGRMVPVQTKVDRLSSVVTKDAHELSSGTVIESVYANHSNRLKEMANASRRDALKLKGTKKSPSAEKVYAEEVKSLNNKLLQAKKNAPFERHAQLLANEEISLKRQNNPGMDADDLKKIKTHALVGARARTGAHKDRIDITQKEWDAIQAGAISTSKLDEILSNTDLDVIKAFALPKTHRTLSNTEIARARQMEKNGYTEDEIADHLGIGLTTLKVGLADA